MWCKEGVFWKEKKEKERRRDRERERETKATWGPVNRLVLNSNNVGNSKHFSQSKRKPQSLGCLCAVAAAAGPCSPGLTGRTVGGLTPQSNRKQGWRRNTNKHSQPCSVLFFFFGAAGWKILDNVTAPCWQEFQGFCCWAAGDWNASYRNISMCMYVCVYLCPINHCLPRIASPCSRYFQGY